MRQVSANALNYLRTQKGVEPIVIVQIAWTDGVVMYYTDRAFIEYPALQGKILTVGNLENVVNVSGSSATESVSIVLDDTDGMIKWYYDRTDIHKRPVWIWQWFTGLDINDKFLLFSGQINSPIVLKEADRTISFEVLSYLEDNEVGFSVEEGQFDSVPDSLIGHAWPLPFGLCLRIPTIQIDQVPNGVSMDGNGVVDPSLYKQLAELGKKILEFAQLAQLMFVYAINSYQMSHYDADGHYQLESVDDQWESQGDQYTDQGNGYLAQMQQVQLEMGNVTKLIGEQRKYGKSSIRVQNGECYDPANLPYMRLNKVKHTGVMNGNTFIVEDVTHPTEEGVPKNLAYTPVQESVNQGGQNYIQNAGFIWIPPGKLVYIDSPYPIFHIIAMLPVQVLNVWAYRSFDNQRFLTQVPMEYYGIETRNFGSLVATCIVLTMPLSHREEGWDDSLFCDVQSPIGPNTVDVIQWLIQTYSTIGIDTDSFDSVRARIDPFPSNFCLMERPQIVQLLSQIAFQARCAIWINNGVFHIRYLPDQPTPVDTITLDDIHLNSLEIHHNESEKVVTKLIAHYKTEYSGDTKENAIILRNNIPKYGVMKYRWEEDTWLIYTVPNLVDLAATFWLIRKSNIWKKIQFTTPLHKLSLETFDAVTINFSNNWVCNGPVVGIIESAKFDSDKLECSFTVWLPIRIGEMTQYDFAWPVDSDEKVYPDNLDMAGGLGPYTDANGNMIGKPCTPQLRYTVKRAPRRKLDHGNPNPGGQTDGTVFLTPNIIGLDDTQQPNFPAAGNKVFNTTPPVAVPVKTQTVVGKIVQAATTANMYNVQLYTRGLDGRPSNTSARCAIELPTPLDAGTVIMCSINVWQEKDQNKRLVTKMEKVFLPAAAKPGCYPGLIQSGSGATYQVKIFKSGLDKPGVVVTVKQLDIDPTDTIPVDAWTIVGETVKTDPATGKATSDYFMQVPVFLE